MVSDADDGEEERSVNHSSARGVVLNVSGSNSYRDVMNKKKMSSPHT